MGIISKLIAAAVVLGIGWMLLSAYGDMKFDAGWQAATTAQKEEADKNKKDMDDAKKASQDRLDALHLQLASTLSELEEVKKHALQTDKEYAAWRAGRIPAAARFRIWGVRDKAPGGDNRRSP